MRLVFLLTFVLAQSAYACDICGCFFGIVPYDNQSTISFIHRYRVFNGYREYNQQERYFPSGAYRVLHGSTPHDSVITRNYLSSDYESYKVYELRAKYFIHKRLELNMSGAIVSNKSKEDTVRYSTTGIGDPSLFLGYHIIRPRDDRSLRIRWIVGAGIKIPSGNYYVKDANNKRLPALIQNGTGSVDYFQYTTLTMGYKKWGTSQTVNYKENGTNYYQERIGNSFTHFSNYFYIVKLNKWVLIPSVNTYFEYTKGMYVFNQLQDGTKMKELMLGGGLDTYYRNIGISLQWQKTVYQYREKNDLSSVGRLMVALTYNFNQRNFLLHKRQSTGNDPSK